MASELTEKILTYLEVKGETNTILLASDFKTDHQKVIGAVNSLISLGDLITTEPETHNVWELSEEGNSVAKKGSHEAATFHAIPDEGLPLKKLKTVLPDKNLNSIGFSKAMANGWLIVDKSGTEPIIKKKVSVINDTVCQHLKMVGTPEFDNLAESFRQDYKKRKLVTEVTVKSYRIKKGTDFRTSISKAETDLTHDMIANGTWKEMSFKSYNFDALGVPPERGHLHPLMKVRAEVKQIFLEMGFTEMPTNNYVESSFWNFDALYVPQQHPARDDHDTFFISDPQVATKFPEDCLGKVQAVHEKGGYGSLGYRYDWKLEEAEKNVLRTHTTAVSARMLHKLAHEGFKPVKYFSIDKVFRNESLDATHLAEFHQVEGVLADYNLTLGDLMGVISAFFKKLGMKEIRFKPTYNPYTEPSMEAYSYHEGLGKWIEIGNSGIFRPELLRPLGIPENVNVLGYGLSLERPTMIRYGINNIRDLVGPKVDLQMVYDNPLCRMEKNTSQQKSSLQDIVKQWDNIHLELNKLKIQVKSLLDQEIGWSDRNIIYEPYQEISCSKSQKIEIEIVCPLKFPGYSLLILIKRLTKIFKTRLSLNADLKSLPNELANFFDLYSTKNNFTSEVDIKFTFTSSICEASLKLPSKDVEIVGEVNVGRYLNRLLESKSDSHIVYESISLVHSCEIDVWLDKLYLASKQWYKLTDILQLAESHLELKKWLVGNIPTLADICLWSFLKQSKPVPKLPKQMELWLHNCSAYCDL